MGALMGVLIKAVSLILETRHAMPRAFIVGTIVSLALVVLLRLGLRSVINFSLSDLISETALFWLELPSLIFLVASGWASRQLAFSRM
jgi:hypothetical protein